MRSYLKIRDIQPYNNLHLKLRFRMKRDSSLTLHEAITMCLLSQACLNGTNEIRYQVRSGAGKIGRLLEWI